MCEYRVDVRGPSRKKSQARKSGVGLRARAVLLRARGLVRIHHSIGPTSRHSTYGCTTTKHTMLRLYTLLHTMQIRVHTRHAATGSPLVVVRTHAARSRACAHTVSCACATLRFFFGFPTGCTQYSCNVHAPLRRPARRRVPPLILLEAEQRHAAVSEPDALHTLDVGLGAQARRAPASASSVSCFSARARTRICHLHLPHYCMVWCGAGGRWRGEWTTTITGRSRWRWTPKCEMRGV